MIKERNNPIIEDETEEFLYEENSLLNDIDIFSDEYDEEEIQEEIIKEEADTKTTSGKNNTAQEDYPINESIGKDIMGLDINYTLTYSDTEKRKKEFRKLKKKIKKVKQETSRSILPKPHVYKNKFTKLNIDEKKIFNFNNERIQPDLNKKKNIQEKLIDYKVKKTNIHSNDEKKTQEKNMILSLNKSTKKNLREIKKEKHVPNFFKTGIYKNKSLKFNILDKKSFSHNIEKKHISLANEKSKNYETKKIDINLDKEKVLVKEKLSNNETQNNFINLDKKKSIQEKFTAFNFSLDNKNKLKEDLSEYKIQKKDINLNKEKILVKEKLANNETQDTFINLDKKKSTQEKFILLTSPKENKNKLEMIKKDSLSNFSLDKKMKL